MPAQSMIVRAIFKLRERDLKNAQQYIKNAQNSKIALDIATVLNAAHTNLGPVSEITPNPKSSFWPIGGTRRNVANFPIIIIFLYEIFCNLI